MKITDIKTQRRKARYNVYVDGKFCFGVSEKVFLDQNIFIGKDISQTEIDKIIAKEGREKSFEKALRFLSFRPRSIKETENYLIKKGFDQKEIQQTTQKLKNLGLLNDLEFASAWIKDRIKLKPSGRIRIILELKQKGVPKEIIEKALEDFSDDQEFTLAYQEALKKNEHMGHLTKREKKQKIISYLLRKGFYYPLIQKVFQKIEENNEKFL